MASYAPNFTARLKLSYSTLGANFSQTWRVGTGFTPDSIVPNLLQFYTAIASSLASDFRINSAEGAAQGEDFFLPTDGGDLFDFEGINTATIPNVAEFRACALQFLGKTVTGNPWRVNVYGTLVAPFNTASASLSDDFRISASDSTQISDAIVALEGASISGLCGNDGNAIIFRPYANIIISRYRINRIRKFG